MNPEIRTAIIKELSIESLPEQAQDQIIAQLGGIVLQATTVAIFEKLSPEKRAEFEEVSKDEDPTKIQEFLAAQVPNMQELMSEELKKVIEQFKQGEDTVVEKTEE